jgi:lysophospholipase L1-like esterase
MKHPSIALSRRTLMKDAAAVTAGAAVATSVAARPALAGDARPLRRHWVASWAASQVAPKSADPIASVGLTDQTVRHVLRLSAGGTVRLRFANPSGGRPMPLGPVTVARRAKGTTGPSAAIDPATVRQVTFDGAPRGLLAAGASLTSDPIAMRVPDGTDLVVSAYLAGPTGPISLHRYGHATGYVSVAGDHTADPDPAAFPTTTTSFLLLSAIEVDRADSMALAVLGDSITEGVGVPDDTNQRWPDLLAQRLARHGHWPAVANLGISGNRVLLDGELFGQNAQARFDRDVLALPNLRTLIIFLGINDIQQEPHQVDAGVLAAGLRQLVSRGHDRGLRVLGATILPFEGWFRYTPELDAMRQAANALIRSGRVFDAVVDFDAALRDPAHITHLLPAYDSGDGLHPNAAGAAALAATVSL